MGSIIAQINAICKEEIANKMQQAVETAAKDLEDAMRESIDAEVYGTAISGDFARTGAFKDGWRAETTITDMNGHIDLHYNPIGSHLSVDESQDVTGSLDDLIIQGSGDIIPSEANYGRDYFTPVDAKAESIVNAAISKTLG